MASNPETWSLVPPLLGHRPLHASFSHLVLGSSGCHTNNHKLGGSNNIISHSPGVQQSKIKLWATLVPSGTLQGEPDPHSFLASAGCQRSSAFLGSLTSFQFLPLSSHGLLPCLFPLCLFSILLRSPVIRFRAHLNPLWPLHLSAFSRATEPGRWIKICRKSYY